MPNSKDQYDNTIILQLHKQFYNFIRWYYIGEIGNHQCLHVLMNFFYYILCNIHYFSKQLCFKASKGNMEFIGINQQILIEQGKMLECL